MSEKQQPINILGAARSGTKFLRDVLAESEHVRKVPYDVSFIWRRGNEDWPDDALPLSRLTPEIAKSIRRGLARVARPRKAKTPAFLLEKTVGNTVRAPFVEGVFPAAKYIHLIRDGRAVVESSWRMWHEPAESGYLLKKLKDCFSFSDLKYFLKYALNLLKGRLKSGRAMNVWGVRYPGIEQDVLNLSIAEVCARQWVESVERTREALRAIPAFRQTTVHYEALTEDDSEIKRLCEFIGISDTERVCQRYKDQLASKSGFCWEKCFEDETRAKIEAVLHPSLVSLGYK